MGGSLGSEQLLELPDCASSGPPQGAKESLLGHLRSLCDPLTTSPRRSWMGAFSYVGYPVHPFPKRGN